MNTVKRIWSEEELILTYYITKYDLSGLNIDFEDITICLLKETSTSSLKMQMANFRYILDIEGRKLSDASKLMYKICEDLKDKTITQVRSLVLDFIDKNCECIEERRVSEKNKIVNQKRDELNKSYQINFENKLAEIKKMRRLTRVVKK